MRPRLKRLVRRLAEAAWPRFEREEDLNPRALFEEYERSAQRIGEAKGNANIETLLQMSRHMFEAENTRSSSIDARAGVLIGATGVVGTLLAGIGAGVLGGINLALPGRIPLLIAYLVALVFFARASIVALSVHGPAVRHVVGPSELMPPEGRSDQGDLRADLASTLARFSADNFRMNNRKMEALRIAQLCFRNAVVIVVVGAMFLPFLAGLNGG